MDPKLELKKILKKRDNVDWVKMVYPRPSVKIGPGAGPKLTSRAKKVCQGYMKYLDHIAEGRCSPTDITEYYADNKSGKKDSEFRNAQKKFDKPLRKLEKNKVLKKFHGKKDLEKKGNRSFYFFTPAGRVLYDEIISEAKQNNILDMINKYSQAETVDEKILFIDEMKYFVEDNRILTDDKRTLVKFLSEIALDSGEYPKTRIEAIKAYHHVWSREFSKHEMDCRLYKVKEQSLLDNLFHLVKELTSDKNEFIGVFPLDVITEIFSDLHGVMKEPSKSGIPLDFLDFYIERAIGKEKPFYAYMGEDPFHAYFSEFNRENLQENEFSYLLERLMEKAQELAKEDAQKKLENPYDPPKDSTHISRILHLISHLRSE